MISLIPYAFAQSSSDCAGIHNPVLPFITGCGPGETAIGNLIGALMGMILIFGAILAFLHLLFGGIRWITASGDKTAMQDAQDRITQAIVGLIIMAVVWTVMVLLGNFTGIGFPNFKIPSITNVGNSGGDGSTSNYGTCTTGTCVPDAQTCLISQHHPTGQSCQLSNGGPQGICCQ